jgi:hypothetical protein
MPHAFWLRLRLTASGCIDGPSKAACFAVVVSLVLADESMRHLRRNALYR